eukprot:3641402-Pyramimonas_sp.AAC.1
MHRCKVIDTPPSPEAMMRKRLILSWFVSKRSSSHIIVRGLLDLLASGDWNSRRLEIYVPPGTEYDEQSLFSTVASGIAKALVFKNFTVYQRKKWMGADEACCEFALPLLLGNVLVEAYTVFCDRLKGLPYRPDAHHPGG